MNDRLPVITGASAICSLGWRLGRVLEGLFGGKPNFSRPAFDSRVFEHRYIAPVPDFEPADAIPDKKALRYMSRETRLAVWACLQCIRDANLETSGNRGNIALFAGTGASGMDLNTIERLLDHCTHPETGRFDPETFGSTALYKLNPLTSFQILPNMPPAMCAILADIRGANLVFNPWEGNALLALNEACFEVRSGRSDIVLCGGSDCKTHSNAFITFSEYGLLAGSDVVLSEGGAYVAVEEKKAAEARKQNIYAAIRYMHHQSRPGPSAVGGICSEAFYVEMIQAALDGCGFQPEDIDLVLASNDFTPRTDAVENAAIARFFNCPVISPKKVIGNAYAAAGMIHVALGAQLLRRGVEMNGGPVRRILITSFAPGSEKLCIILEAL